MTARSGILLDLGRLDDTQAARHEADLHGGTTRHTVQSASFQLLLSAARQAIDDDLPELAEESPNARGRIVAVIRPYTSSDDDVRDLTTALIGYTFMALSTGVPVDSEDLHRFVRRQFAIYSVRGHAPAGSNPTPTRGH